MLSEGSKIEYLCPQCGSRNIEQLRVIGQQKFGACGDCGTWWPWRTRTKRRASVGQEERK